MSTPLKVFCCYAREDQEMLARLKTHLMPLQRDGQITIWSDTNINAGVEWEKELHHHLESADLILLLISPDFMSSDYCYSTEMKRAIERHKQGSAHVIPILLRSTLWRDAPFAKIQIVPRDTRPVKSWPDIDEAFNSVTESIKQVVSSCTLIEADRYDGMAKLAPPSPANIGTQVVQRPRGLSRITVILLAGLAFLVIVGSIVGVFYIKFWPNISKTPTPSPTITRGNQQPPYPPFGKLVFSDVLTKNNPVHGWDEYPLNLSGGVCQFKGGAYHSIASHVDKLNACLANKSNFDNFAFEAQMKIIRGDCGGLFFRSSPRSPDWQKWTFYSFEICQNGTYRFRESFNDSGSKSSSAIHTGLKQFNVIKVVANNDTLDLYVNGKWIDNFSGDGKYSQGKIGVEARPLTSPTEVEFRDAKVWISSG